MANDVGVTVHPRGVREVNSGAVLELLLRQRRTTRTELVHLSGLSKATVSGIVSELLDEGFATPGGREQSGRGRSRVVLEFNPLARSVLGVQIEDEDCTVVLSDLDGRAYEEGRYRLSGSDLDTVLDSVTRGIADLRSRAVSPVLGLGVGVPGDVDRTGRHIREAVSHGWSDVPIADLLEERVGLPVVTANRAKVGALGQLGADAGDRAPDLIYVFLGSGVIAGLVIDGQLCIGRDGGAGDIGHVTIEPNGSLCGCGNRGCLHTVAGEQAILALARSRAREARADSLLSSLVDGRLAALSLAVLADAVHQQDPTALAVADEVGSRLGIVIANLVNTLNPDAVIIAGPTTRMGDPLVEPIRREVRRRALSEVSRKLDITVDRHGSRSGAAGAASLWISRLATSPPHLLVGDRSTDPNTEERPCARPM